MINIPQERVYNNEKVKTKKRIYLQINDIIKCCSEALEYNPRNRNALYNLGKCFIEQNKIKDVRKVIEKMRFVNGKDRNISILEGHLLIKEGSLMEAYKKFIKVMEKEEMNKSDYKYCIGNNKYVNGRQYSFDQLREIDQMSTNKNIYDSSKFVINQKRTDQLNKEYVYDTFVNNHRPSLNILNSEYSIRNEEDDSISQLDDSPFDVFLAYGFGLLYEVMENYKLSRQWYTFILNYDIELHKYVEILFRVGVCYKKENMLNDALNVFNLLMSMKYTDTFKIEIFIQLGHIYERLNDLDKSLDYLLELKRYGDRSVKLNRLLMWIYYRRGDYKTIKEKQNCIHKKLNKDKRAYAEMNTFTDDRGNYGRRVSINRSEKGIYLDKYDEMNSFNDRYMNNYQKSPNSFVSDPSKIRLSAYAPLCVCEEEIRDPYILYLIGRVYLNENQYDKAIEFFEDSIKLDPKMYLAYNSLGVIKYYMNDLERARKFFNMSLTCRPLFKEALNNLSVIDYIKRSPYNDQKIIDAYPDISKTRYLDSQIINREYIQYPDLLTIETIKDINPPKIN